MATEDQPATPAGQKQFGLKTIEQQMLQSMQDSYFNALSNFLTFVATERLAYAVTPNTKFVVDGDTLKIWEEEPATEAPNEQPAAGPVKDEPTVATNDTPTADALKG